MPNIEDELDRLGLEPSWRGRYWHIHCPLHEDRNKSAVCFEDGWIHCFAGCRRTHINKLAGRKVATVTTTHVEEEKHDNNYMDKWLDLEPVDTDIKGVPASVLNKVGWRKYNNDIFIPYFNVSRTAIPFYQIRHLTGERRFSFAPGEKPITYGLDVLPKVKKFLFVTEGSRDSVILRWAGLNAVALPSASSHKNLEKLQKYVMDNGILLCWCGDRDDAGERLMSNLHIPYVDVRCPYKDVGEMLEAEGIDKVKEYYETYIEESH